MKIHIGDRSGKFTVVMLKGGHTEEQREAFRKIVKAANLTFSSGIKKWGAPKKDWGVAKAYLRAHRAIELFLAAGHEVTGDLADVKMMADTYRKQVGEAAANKLIEERSPRTKPRKPAETKTE
jgi:hypothetical protein